MIHCLSRTLVSFMATIPLEMLFDFGGEQMALYFRKAGRPTDFIMFIDMLLQDLGDLIVVTLNK